MSFQFRARLSSCEVNCYYVLFAFLFHSCYFIFASCYAAVYGISGIVLYRLPATGSRSPGNGRDPLPAVSYIDFLAPKPSPRPTLTLALSLL